MTLWPGWDHEYADTSRPLTAAFAGAPAVPFTVYGAQPLRDAAVVGLGLNAQIGASTSIYARYDGEITGRDDTPAISASVCMTWWGTPRQDRPRAVDCTSSSRCHGDHVHAV